LILASIKQNRPSLVNQAMRELLKTQISDIELLAEMAFDLHSQKMYENAEIAFSKLLELDNSQTPQKVIDYASLYQSLGEISQHRRNLKDSVNYFENALDFAVGEHQQILKLKLEEVRRELPQLLTINNKD